MEFRVAAEFCFGLGDFSKVVDTLSPPDEETSSAKEEKEEVCLQPPTDIKVRSLTGTTVGLEWTPPPGDFHRLVLHISYWKKGDKESSTTEWQTGCDWTRLWLDNLSPETTYQLHMATSLQWDEMMGPSSEIVEFTTKDELRFVDTFVKKWKKIRNENGKDLYAVPLTGSIRTTADRFVFNEGEHVPQFDTKHRTILLVGTSDSGKMSLINSMANYILNVNLEDPFLFELVEAENEKKVKTYNIRHGEEFRIEYSLTIVDTPSYVENDPIKNQTITEMIRNFVDEEKGVQQLDMIGFVMDSSKSDLTSLQLYIYSSLISIFGNDVIKNLKFLLTSANNEDPYFWEDVVDAGLVYHGPCLQSFNQRIHKFNSSIFVCSDQETEWMDNFKTFFLSIEHEGQTSVPHRKKMLEEMKRLKTVVTELNLSIFIQMVQLEELQSTKQEIGNNLVQIDADENVEFELEKVIGEEKNLPLGHYVTNCKKCKITCHSVCNDTKIKLFCDVMDQSQPSLKDVNCLVCPGKCSWSFHVHQSFKWRFSQEEQTISLLVVKKKYEAELEKNLTSQELVEALRADIESKKNVLMERIESAVGFKQKHDEIVKHLELDDSVPLRINGVLNVINNLIIFQEENESSDAEMLIKLKNLLQAAAGPLVVVDVSESEDQLILEYYHSSDFVTETEDESASEDD